MLIREGFKGVLAGLCITLGGCVLLGCDSRYVGAMLFSVALLTICMFGFSLYTGKVGYIVDNHGKKDILLLLFCLLGNAIGCFGFGLLARVALPAFADKAALMVLSKLEQPFHVALIRAFFCGVLMYIAVRMYREKGSVLGIFVCVPAFILSGFEHSIANMFYFAISLRVDLESVLYLLIIVLGNSLGGWCIPLLEKLTKEKAKA